MLRVVLIIMTVYFRAGSIFSLIDTLICGAGENSRVRFTSCAGTKKT
jgi:hypothetical protein